MIDLDESHWKTPCPKIGCEKKTCACGLEFVSIPSVLAEEMTPANGCFANKIVRYENTGEVWIYDKNGVPVLVKEGNDAS